MQFILIYATNTAKGRRRGVGVTTVSKVFKDFYERFQDVTLIDEARGTTNRLAAGDRNTLEKYRGRDEMFIIEGGSKEICSKAMSTLCPKWNAYDVQYIEVNASFGKNEVGDIF